MKTAWCFQLMCIYVISLVVFGGSFFSRNNSSNHGWMQKVKLVKPYIIVEVEPRVRCLSGTITGELGVIRTSPNVMRTRNNHMTISRKGGK